jgi:Cysteine rich repeat
MKRPLNVALNLILAVAALAAAGPLFAAGPQPCRDDAQKHCSGVQRGGGRIVACLQEHQAELTPACQAALPTMARCSEELRKVCGDASSPRALRSCLREKQGQLSAECRAGAQAR